jgi:hypothetical protein
LFAALDAILVAREADSMVPDARRSVAGRTVRAGEEVKKGRGVMGKETKAAHGRCKGESGHDAAPVRQQ